MPAPLWPMMLFQLAAFDFEIDSSRSAQNSSVSPRIDGRAPGDQVDSLRTSKRVPLVK